MNITEACAMQRVTQFLAGDIDHCDDLTRRAVAVDIAFLQERAAKALHAGGASDAETWDERLCNVTFEGVSA